MLLDKLNDYRLILASRSPRRRELMSGVGLKFDIAADYEVEEIYPGSLPVADVPLFLAGLKSKNYPHPLLGNEILITADTVVIVDGRILGKPSDRQDAVDMLTVLAGRRHTVVSGVVMRAADREEGFSVSTDVWMSPLSGEEIEYYVDNYKPFDKAGSYGIQEWIGYAAIERVEGSFYNVMGLPVCQLYKRLDKFIP